MIIKSYELEKIKLKEFKYFLFYGGNKGLINDTINSLIKPLIPNNIYRYEESEIINNLDNFIENLSSKSFFDNEKLIIISRTTDKLHQIIKDIIEKSHEDIIILLISDILEKKSKIRNLFEKDKKTICTPFYEDNFQTLNFLTQKYLKSKKIYISQENINLIINRCSNDRINLYNELNKIENFYKNEKTINTESILKLTNLGENFSISELIDNTLTKNHKKILNIMNENIFINEDSIVILRIFLSKLKRLLKIQAQINNETNLEKVISSFKPAIFWKEKDLIKQQIKIWSYDKIQELIIKVNNLELLVKKYPNTSTNFVTDFLLEQSTTKISN